MDYGAFREIVEHARRTPEAIGLVVKAWARLPEHLQASALDLAKRRLDVLLAWDDLLTLGDAVEWCVLSIGEDGSSVDQAVSVAWWLGLIGGSGFLATIGLGAGRFLWFARYFEPLLANSILPYDNLGMSDRSNSGHQARVNCPYLTDECLAPWLQRSA